MSNVHCTLIVHGPLLTKRVYDFLKSAGYDIALLKTNEHVPPLAHVKNPPAYRCDATIGKLQLLGVLRRETFVYIRAHNAEEEVVLRREGQQIHTIYGRNGRFAYLSMNSYEFELEVSQAEAALAVVVISGLFTDVKRRRVHLDTYSDFPFDQFKQFQSNFDYVAAYQQIGWQWR